MNTLRIAPLLALAAGLLAPAPLVAQADKPDRGKIDGVEREGRRASRNAGGDDRGGWFIELILGLFRGDDHAHAAPPDEPPPPRPGRGYGPYPWYADTTGDSIVVEPFVREHVMERRGFHALSATYFDDNAIGGSLRAGQLSYEAASGAASLSLEYTLYREPTQRDVDWLHTARIGLDVLPRIGRIGFARAGVAARGLVLDNGMAAGGPELEVGFQAFPARPWGVAATARGAIVEWSGGGSSGMAELTAQASYSIGRFELMAGWRYLKIGSAEAFNGPTAGLRVWF